MNSRIAWILVSVGALGLMAMVLAGRWGMPDARGAETPRKSHDTDAKAMKTPVLVELFTSEGCSSCPPADKLLTQLATEQPIPGAEIIVLGGHVDYWDHQGWRDPFSSRQFTDRQFAYARALGLQNVYTPQMVVDGVSELLGSDSQQAYTAISQAAKRPKVAVRMRRVRHDATEQSGSMNLDIQVAVPASITDANSVQVLLALTEDKLSSEVKGGENSGRHLAHFGVVRQLQSVGTLTPNQPFHVSPMVRLNQNWKTEDLSAVVFVQETRSHHILGVGSLALKR